MDDRTKLERAGFIVVNDFDTGKPLLVKRAQIGLVAPHPQGGAEVCRREDTGRHVRQSVEEIADLIEDTVPEKHDPDVD